MPGTLCGSREGLIHVLADCQTYRLLIGTSLDGASSMAMSVLNTLHCIHLTRINVICPIRRIRLPVSAITATTHT